MLRWTFLSRVTCSGQGNQDAEVRRPGGPRPRDASRPDPEAARAEVAQVLAAIGAPSSQFDGDSVDIEPMNVPHSSKINGSGSHLDEIYVPRIPSIFDSAEPEEVEEREPRHAQRRMGYFDVHPERRRMTDILDQFAQAASDMEPLPRRSDTNTNSIYSSGPMSPTLPAHALTIPMMECLQVDATVVMVSLPSLLPTSIVSPQTPSPLPSAQQASLRPPTSTLTARRLARACRAMRSKQRGCPAKAWEKDVGQLVWSGRKRGARCF